jgi:hypothetical protein
MTNHNLIDVLKSLNYNDSSIKKIVAAAEAAEMESVRASRGDMTELLSPLQVAAQGPRHAAQLRQLDSAIFHASGAKYRLPKDRPVDINEVEAAIRGASITSRMNIKSSLHALKLIAA